jgi:hypothetical protein
MNENATVQAQRARLRDARLEGTDEGYHSANTPLPAWWFTTAPGHMTARQRGYFFGRLLREDEEDTP